VESHPAIIQGGMGVAVSGWRLAKAVSGLGQLGVVSGTALDVVLARRLQQGDPEGHIRRAIAAFPDQELAQRILEAYFVEGGRPAGESFKSAPVFSATPTRRNNELAVLSGFVEVFLGKEGHDGVVGINFLEKIQLPTPATLYGALLAGVNYVLVGAGIPRHIPGLIDALILHDKVALPLHVTGVEAGQTIELSFDPRSVMDVELEPLGRPDFLAIIASAALAVSLTRHTSGVNGFVVEGPTAGGHNAPPRGQLVLEEGEPVYGPRDEVDLEKVAAVGLPFWLAGGYATPQGLLDAQANGAAGIQVGTLFAFCNESGVEPGLRSQVVAEARTGELKVFTDPLASPTGFPFKVAGINGTLSEPEVRDAREARCDLGYLREIFVKGDGSLGYRCPAEPVEDYVRKGGSIEETIGRRCICNGLMATAGYAQHRQGVPEPAIVTAGNDLENLGRLIPKDADSYAAADVIACLLDTAATQADPAATVAPSC